MRTVSREIDILYWSRGNVTAAAAPPHNDVWRGPRRGWLWDGCPLNDWSTLTDFGASFPGPVIRDVKLVFCLHKIHKIHEIHFRHLHKIRFGSISTYIRLSPLPFRAFCNNWVLNLFTLLRVIDFGGSFTLMANHHHHRRGSRHYPTGFLMHLHAPFPIFPKNPAKSETGSTLFHCNPFPPHLKFEVCLVMRP